MIETKARSKLKRLNVYTSKIEGGLSPVLVILQDSLVEVQDLSPVNFFDGDGDLVVVQVTSRVGPLGFLTLGSKAMLKYSCAPNHRNEKSDAVAARGRPFQL